MDSLKIKYKIKFVPRVTVDQKTFLHKLFSSQCFSMCALLYLRRYWLRFYLVIDLINWVCHLPYAYPQPWQAYLISEHAEPLVWKYIP